MSKKLMKDPTLPPGEEVFAILNGVTHYTNGRFEYLPDINLEDPEKGSYGYSTWLTNYHWVASDSLNKLKGKMYNIIEASGLDERQAEAMKKLMKGFATESYHEINDGFKRFISDMGFKKQLENLAVPMSSDPLTDFSSN